MSGRRHLQPGPDPESETTPEFMDAVFTFSELMKLSSTDLDELEALRDNTEGTALWWALWRASRLERAARGGER